MPLLEVQHLQKVYTSRFGGRQVEALQNVNFSVEPGEYVAIMGESGSGKTTLLNILAALDRPTAGEVFLNGKALSDVRERDLAAFRRSHLGFVFQDFNLLDTFSLRDNIYLPLVLAAALLMPGEFALRLPIEFLPLGALSLLLAMLLTSAVTVALTGSYFWTISGQGINRIVPMLGNLLAGNVVPLGLFPAGIRQVLRALPFASMLDAPLRILVGAVNLQQALELVGLQMAWLIGLLALGRCVIHAGVRKCVVQGG